MLMARRRQAHRGRPSGAVGRGVRRASSPLDPALYAAHGGAFPIRVAGAGVIGVVAVSGLPQREDHALVVTALTQFLS
jgi:uncharacterized protein (UPF0303 family)